MIDFGILQHLLALLIGISSGLLAGILPGVGVFLVMLMLTPILSTWAPLDIFLCYAAMIQISQFVGSVTTLYTGVPGETSSMPTVLELKRLPQHRLSETIAATSVGSFLAAVLSIALCGVLATHLGEVSYIFRTEIIFVMLVTAIFFVIKYSENTFWVSGVLFVVGVLLSLVGYNNTIERTILTFGSADLFGGIPIDAIIVCLFVGPQLYQLSSLPLDATARIPILFAWPSLNYIKILWYSGLGFIGGLLPGLSTTFSSLLCYNITSRTTQDPYERIIAAETANNAGAVSQLIPMLIFGLPIVASEAITLSLMEVKGFAAGIVPASTYFIGTAPIMVAVAIIGMIMAWPLASRCLFLLRMNMTMFRVGAISTMLIIIIWQAWLDYNMVFVLTCIGVLAVAGWLVRHRDTTCLIFGVLVGDKLLDHSVRLYSLYF